MIIFTLVAEMAVCVCMCVYVCVLCVFSTLG